MGSLALPPQARGLLESQGYTKLYPPQAKAVRAGLLGGRSVVVSAPTASGKTLIATMAMMAHLEGRPGRAVYLSPLRALAAEKHREFSKLAGIKLGGSPPRAAVSTGDSPRFAAAGARILVLTNESMDASLRGSAAWTKEIGLVVVDEVHLVGDAERGPTLETVLARLARMRPRPQLVCLSATVTNAAEMSKWLGCRLVSSDWRPVPLSEGVWDSGTVRVPGGDDYEVATSRRGPAIDIALDAVKSGSQSLVFAETRARAASLALKAADAVRGSLSAQDREKLELAARRMREDPDATEAVLKLADAVSSGAAFHHAGLPQECREAVEDGFRGGAVKLVASTPTLAAGINLPARRVVISSVTRYDPAAGYNKPISVMEYKQLCGRAGRPQYDRLGESVIVSGGSAGADELAERYVHGQPEPVVSAMAAPRPLRIHALSLMVTDPGISRGGLGEFFAGTLGGAQDDGIMETTLDRAVDFLESEGLADSADGYRATRFGRMASRLYLDPATAVQIRNGLQGARPGRCAFGLLHLVSECPEFFPRMYLREKDAGEAQALIDAHKREMLEPVYADGCNRSLLALYRWMSEEPARRISEDLKVELGDMRRIAESAERLLYCTAQLARGFERGELSGELEQLRARAAYGVRAELCELVRVRGVGRVRARALYRRGLRTLRDLRGADESKISRIEGMGPATARGIKAHLRRLG